MNELIKKACQEFTLTKEQPAVNGLAVWAGTCQWKPDGPGPNQAKANIMAVDGPFMPHRILWKKSLWQ